MKFPGRVSYLWLSHVQDHPAAALIRRRAQSADTPNTASERPLTLADAACDHVGARMTSQLRLGRAGTRSAEAEIQSRNGGK